ncbi:MAG: redoxin family protein [Comamonas sp.]|nr:redoxin family protein [Comamonas sp.]
MRSLPIAASALASALLLPAAWAQPLQVPGLAATTQAEVLSAEQAFVLQRPALGADNTPAPKLALAWSIAPGYYLYRDQIRITDAQGRSLSLEVPAGESLTDPFFGRVQVFHQQLDVQASLPEHSSQWPLQVHWQGCAHLGVCYQPQQATVTERQLGLEQPPAPVDRAEPDQPPLPTPDHWLALPPSLSLGPLVLPTMALAALLAIFVGQCWAASRQRRSGRPVEALLLQATAAGLISARLAYVALWWREYLAELPSGLLQVVDIRDGGWNLWAGLLAALLWTFWRGRRDSGLRRSALQALAAGALILVTAQALRTLPAPQPAALPAMAFVNAAAQTVDLRSHTGQPLVINLWASWCPPCRREMPALAQAQKEHPEIRFVWINQGEDAAAVLRYLQTMALPPEQVLLDPQLRAGQHWQQRGLPSTFFYDAGGRLQGMRMGELSRASLAEQLHRLESASTR